MKLRRDIASIPYRNAEATWTKVRDLLADSKSLDYAQFDMAGATLASLIADESFKDVPLTLVSKSYRVVVYLKHGADAIEAGEGVDALPEIPTHKDWRLYFECPDEQYQWVKKNLGACTRFTVLKEGEALPEDAIETQKSQALEINWGAFQ